MQNPDQRNSCGPPTCYIFVPPCIINSFSIRIEIFHDFYLKGLYIFMVSCGLFRKHCAEKLVLAIIPVKSSVMCERDELKGLRSSRKIIATSIKE